MNHKETLSVSGCVLAATPLSQWTENTRHEDHLNALDVTSWEFDIACLICRNRREDPVGTVAFLTLASYSVCGHNNNLQD